MDTPTGGAQGGSQNNTNPNAGKNSLSWSTPQSTPTAVAQPMVAAKPAQTPVSAAPASTSGGTNSAKIVGWLAVGIVAGVLIAWAVFGLFKGGAAGTVATSTAQNSTSTTATSTETASNTSADSAASAVHSVSGLAVASPQKAGTSVAVTDVSVSSPTWVAVYDSRNGQPGNVLGAKLFFPGQTSGRVELLRSTTAGQSYLVTKQTDNGDRKFSLHIDRIVTEGGVPLWVTFTAN